MTVTLGWPSWIGVVAEDLDRQRRFYGEVLGFTEIAAGPDWAHFDLGEERLLEIMQRSGRVGRFAGGHSAVPR